MKVLQVFRRMASVDLHSLRMKYKAKRDVILESNILVKEPFNILREWMNEALATPEILEPNAASLSTVDVNGCPSNRYVLLKDFSDQGFTFFTNYNSRKANDIKTNPNVAMTIYWCPLRRSVRIEGVAEKISPQESEAYFRGRPRDSQIGALVSNQSQKIPSRQHLDEIEKGIRESVGENEPIPMPDWGGYIIKPSSIEFWQGQSDRLHDRIRFRRGNNVEIEIDGKLTYRGVNNWVYERLAP